MQVRWTKTAGSASDKFQETSIYNETLRIEGIQRVQGGRYYCKADNGVGVAAIKSIRVDVQCKWSGRDGSTSRPQPTVTATIPTVSDGGEMERLGGGRKDERQIGLCDDISGGNSFQEYLIVDRMKDMVGRLKGKWIYRFHGRVQIRECKRLKEELLFPMSSVKSEPMDFVRYSSEK